MAVGGVTKCDAVVMKLQEKIISGGYRVGDRIPPETALCEMYEVSRITIREALKKLSMMGLVEIRQGRGTFVKNVDLGMFMKPLYQMIDFEEIDIDVLYESREFVEGGIAVLAAKKRTERDLDSLRALLSDMREQIASGDMPGLVETDSLFHAALARAAHNPILQAAERALDEINSACIKRYDKLLVLLDDCHNEHREIYLAIEAGDAEAAHAAMVRHTHNSAALLKS